MNDIVYYYAAYSAFAYLGSARFMQIARDAGRRIAHRPVDLDRVIEAAGSSAFKARSDAFRQYFFVREIQRWSEERGAPVGGRPTNHYSDITRAHLMIVAGVQAGQDVDALAHGMLEAHWRHDADLGDVRALVRIATENGYDATALMEAGDTRAVQDAYEANTRDAIERSVFGSPTYLVDGDLFYGQDRLEMVERALVKPYARGWSGPEGG